ncbi:hypothetical protein [Methanosphaerula subterraneus]|uniref:hypothetical protein n=1 Tax=Methanosphaerula subterraneus TaxID=3350244 RepID=UPI003F85D111
MQSSAKTGDARIKSNNQVIGDLKGIEIGTNDVFSSLRGMDSSFRPGIAKCYTEVEVWIDEGNFEVNPLTGSTQDFTSLEDTNKTFLFDVELFDDSGDSRVTCTVSQCCITNHGIAPRTKDGKWVLRKIHCDGRDVIYH